METKIIEIDGAAMQKRLVALSDILACSVAEGAAIGFMMPLSPDEASLFWSTVIQPEVVAGRRILLGAERDGKLVGTVQVIIAMPQNQSHRGEIAKMIVHPHARRLGVGRKLMHHALDRARDFGKTLVTLDTRTGDVAEPLYASVGFKVAGVIPNFAWDADGKNKHATTYMYRELP